MLKKKKIYPAYVSKHNSNLKNQVILLKIPTREKWHFLTVKNLSALLRGITSKHCGNFCVNCFHSFRAKTKIELHKRVCENKHFCDIIMPPEDTKILEINQYQISDNALFFIYLDLECLIEIIEKIDGCKHNPENSSTKKANKHIPSCFLISTISSFRGIENKHDVCKGRDCMENFCESLR